MFVDTGLPFPSLKYGQDKSTFGKNTKKYVDSPTAQLPTPLQPILDKTTERAGVRLYIKRDDLIHPLVSGNKWRKLKYNLQNAVQEGYGSLLTFGGARSNHLYAAAAAGKALGIQTIGIVRGEEYQSKDTDTLRFCREMGMQIEAISRTEYREKHVPEFLSHLREKFGNVYLVPEGGSTPMALPGVRELVYETEAQLTFKPDYYAVAAGTGGTAAGILSADAQVLAFSALKGGGFLEEEIVKLVNQHVEPDQLKLFTAYHFGGYAKYTAELLDFITDFEQTHQILLEHVYTGKMLFGLYDLIDKGVFPPGTTLIAVHTGGLQGRLSEQERKGHKKSR